MNAILHNSFLSFAEAHGFDVNQELIIDCFAGGGGASEGMEMAMRDMRAAGLLPDDHRCAVDIAINHDPKAIAMHAANHPRTMHLTADIWTADPLTVTGGIAVGALWASPDCRGFSKAKGGAPVSKSVRSLAWVVAHWADQVRPREIYMENVEEFQDWCDLDMTSRPDKNLKGKEFKRWVKRFKKMGYTVEWRVLRANFFGAPTIRKRLYIMMRCDGEQIIWPAETHADRKSEQVASGEMQAWPVAADILDFNRPCPSILMTKEEAKAYTKATGTRIIRPLARNSEARIAMGTLRYVLEREEPFIVTLNHGGDWFRGQGGLDRPFNTVAAARDAHGLVVPHLSAYHSPGAGGLDRSSDVNEPIRTIDTAPRHALIGATVAPHLMTMRNSGKPFAGADEPTHTVTAGGAGLSVVEAELAPFLSHGQHGGRSRSAEDPAHTIEASTKDTNQVVAVYLNKHTSGGVGTAADEAVPTVTANSFIKRPGGASPLGATAVYLAQHNGGPRAPIGREVTDPLSTAATTGSQQAVIAAHLGRQFGNSVGSDMEEPVGAIMPGGGGKTQVVSAHMISMKGSDRRASSVEEPAPATTAQGQHTGVVMPFMTAYFGSDEVGGAPDAPVRTVTVKPRFGHVEAEVEVAPLTDAHLDSARKVAAFLRKYGCWDDREFVTVGPWIVIDIGMRMLTPRELARAQGFRESYILAAPFNGGFLTETDQRHKIGNSVCPDMAYVLFRNNYRPRPRLVVNNDQGWLFSAPSTQRAAA
ncbi:DNA cytosine methyltransferase [Devosia riboflavina]|uniref:DNA cytosine methyltransferase n=1 Tax=Devosia riboflavina TaxID=46914 RepID=UPI00069175F8|nr:DNA cytosine methyltransferase [Devosia riboflavina]